MYSEPTTDKNYQAICHHICFWAAFPRSSIFKTDLFVSLFIVTNELKVLRVLWLKLDRSNKKTMCNLLRVPLSATTLTWWCFLFPKLSSGNVFVALNYWSQQFPAALKQCSADCASSSAALWLLTILHISSVFIVIAPRTRSPQC